MVEPQARRRKSMAYRKISVDGTPYEYVVGRTHVKIRGVGAIPKEVVGVIDERYGVTEVQPSHVSAYILEHVRG
jgi:hypothetical protein